MSMLISPAGVSVLVCPADGPPVRGQVDAADLVGEALGLDAAWVALPVERLPEECFTLSTGVAGEVVQRFANYRLGLAIVGDVAEHVARSEALRDYVGEANRGRQTWFVASFEELEERLGAR
jgi:hypothetical protein